MNGIYEFQCTTWSSDGFKSRMYGSWFFFTVTILLKSQNPLKFLDSGFVNLLIVQKTLDQIHHSNQSPSLDSTTADWYRAAKKEWFWLSWIKLQSMVLNWDQISMMSNFCTTVFCTIFRTLFKFPFSLPLAPCFYTFITRWILFLFFFLPKMMISS